MILHETKFNFFSRLLQDCRVGVKNAGFGASKYMAGFQALEAVIAGYRAGLQTLEQVFKNLLILLQTLQSCFRYSVFSRVSDGLQGFDQDCTACS